MESFGALSLIPPLVIIALAIKMKTTFPALLTGAILAYVIMYGTGFFGPLVDGMYSVLMDGDTVWVIMLTGFIGIFIALVSNSGGIESISRYILKIATTKNRTLLGTMLLAILHPFGDVSSIGTNGVVMKPICDEKKLPREALAYVLDSTAAPLAVLVPVSSWGAFFAGIFMAEPSLNFTGNPMSVYLKVMPFLFYSMAALLIVFLFSAGVLPKLGQMKKAYERVETTGMVYSKKSEALNISSEEELPKDAPGWKMLFFLLPLIAMVAGAVKGHFLEGVMVSIAVCAVMYLPTKTMTFKKFSALATQGFVDMLSPIFIIVGAFMVRDALVAMGLPSYVSELVKPVMSAGIYPAVVFATVAILSFTTGSNWGVPAVMVPIMVPIGLALGTNPFIVLAAVASGGSFGSHACFYSDATVFTSAVCKIDNMEHALTQIPYALISAGLAFLMFLVVGLVI